MPHNIRQIAWVATRPSSRSSDIPTASASFDQWLRDPDTPRQHLIVFSFLAAKVEMKASARSRDDDHLPNDLSNIGGVLVEITEDSLGIVVKVQHFQMSRSIAAGDTNPAIKTPPLPANVIPRELLSCSPLPPNRGRLMFAKREDRKSRFVISVSDFKCLSSAHRPSQTRSNQIVYVPRVFWPS